MANSLKLDGSFWSFIEQLNEHFNLIGFAIIGVFAASWALAGLIYRLKGNLPRAE